MANKKRYRKKKREKIVSLFSFLSLDKQRSIDHWLRGRKQFKEIKQADFVIISPPKCGRTWLRVTLSGFFHSRYGIPDHEILGFDNFHAMNTEVPRVRFCDDRYVSDYSKHRDSKVDYYDRRIIFLIRDPRDVAASNYFQWKNTVNPYKKRLHKIRQQPDELSVFEYAMNEDYGIPKTVRFLNAWEQELAKTKAHLLVHYEDMRADPAAVLKQITDFMQISASDEQIAHAVEYGSMENMRKIEKNTDPGGSRRLMPKDINNPQASKIRRGKVAGYRDYLSDKEQTIIDDYIANNLLPSYGYK
ncbi:MAG: sulfotransferase domain-containing protein [gamma proteobacterium symbiont of Bathyaustriella thionipta]|nr:sulfotransferase domain-containing protein [gamma proteobacterium symbiont of Bathyaustriella thionipta]